jgi:hypothetical protein
LPPELDVTPKKEQNFPEKYRFYEFAETDSSRQIASLLSSFEFHESRKDETIFPQEKI